MMKRKLFGAILALSIVFIPTFAVHAELGDYPMDSSAVIAIIPFDALVLDGYPMDCDE